MKKIIVFILLAFGVVKSVAQNIWPKTFAQPEIFLYNVIEDIDHGFLAIVTYKNDGNSYLLKFDANANLLWKKCLHYSITPYIKTSHFIKDRFNNTYLIGITWDTDPLNGDAFILQLDSVYRKIKSEVLTDSITKGPQYLSCIFNFNDSLMLINGSNFNQFSNHLLFVRKNDLSIKSIYNINGNSTLNNTLTLNNSNYFTFTDWYYLKGGDTNFFAIRTPLLKFSFNNTTKTFFKFFGYENDLLSKGYKVFKNNRGNLFVFSAFFSEKNVSSLNKRYSPMVFESDTNGNMINYKVYNDNLINQELYDVIQFNDSEYYMIMDYYIGQISGSTIRKIKIYKLDEYANRIDSAYLTIGGKPYFKDGHTFSFLLKTFDNKIMCVLNDVDSNFSNSRISFIRLDTNLKEDTTEYRNLQYDYGFNIPNDTITLAGSPIVNLHADAAFPLLILEKPDGNIKVPLQNQYAFFPNPVKETATLSIQNNRNGFVEVILFDEGGKLIRELYMSRGSNSGEENIPLQFNSIDAGIYFIKVIVGHHLQHTIKIVKEE